VIEKRSAEDVRVAITLLRSLKGWSQARLAAEMGRSASSVSRWEAGEAVPGEKAWDQLVAAVGLPPPWVDRVFILIRSLRGVMADPASAYDPDWTLDGISLRVADRVFEIVRAAAATILADLPQSGDDWWDEEDQEPS
jgi:transcriptional regulator with XRE-family HTH domain